MLTWLPHINGFLNLVVVVFLILGYRAIRQGDKVRHPKYMMSAVGTGLIFIVGYGLQTWLAGHVRFPGDDWVRTLFVIILGTHTFLAVLLAPLVPMLLYLGLKGKFVFHRKAARIIFPIWIYVAVTGVVIYWMNNHLRPV